MLCTPPPGAASLWEQRELRFVLIGELHGTAETPAVFAELVCAAVTEANKRVLVGLEFPEAARSAFETYLESSGTAEDRTSFLAESGWVASVRRFPDGRTSEAMWGMLERLRTLRAAGLDISVTTFVRPNSAGNETQTPYEIGMATSLLEAADSDAYDLIVALVGNIHARKSTFGPTGVDSFDPMAMHLPKESTLTLHAVTGGGEAWNCQPECGVHQYDGSPRGSTPGIVLGEDLSPGYHGIVAIGRTTASFPSFR